MVAAQLLADTDSTKFVQGIAIVKIALAFNFFFFFAMLYSLQQVL